MYFASVFCKPSSRESLGSQSNNFLAFVLSASNHYALPGFGIINFEFQLITFLNFIRVIILSASSVIPVAFEVLVVTICPELMLIDCFNLMHQFKDKLNANDHFEVSSILMRYRLRIHSMMYDNIRAIAKLKEDRAPFNNKEKEDITGLLLRIKKTNC